jgi:nucleoside-diphosphate-sugar epimerase
VLVTGATGFVGSHLVRALVADGHDVVVITRPSSDLWRLHDVLDWVELVATDLVHIDADEPHPSLNDVEVVFHLAAEGVTPSADTHAVVESNVVGTLRLLEFARAVGVERFVYAGSCFEYGAGTNLREDALPQPSSDYAASKSAAWLLVHAGSYELPVVSIRPFTVYGPYEAAYRLVPSTILRALEDAPIELTEGEQTRDFVYVEDVVEAFRAAAEREDVVGRTFNACTGIETSVRSLAGLVVESTRSASELRFGALPYRDDELWRLSGDPEVAARELGWVASTPLAEGVRRTAEWFRAERQRHDHYAQEATQR